MNPVAFYIFGLDIRWYGILISFGIIGGLYLVKYNSKFKNISFDTFTNIFLIALPISIIGARLYYVIFEFDNYRNNLIEIINIRHGGLAIHGGLIFGILTTVIYCKVKKISFFDYADTAAPSIALAQSIGRWGNFFNGEAHGDQVSYEFIKHFPGFIQRGMNIGGVYFHPTFLYESVWDITVAIILFILLKNSKDNKGTVIFTYLGLYSIGRYFIEGLRTDSLMIGNIKMAQMISLFGVSIWVIFLLFQIIADKRKKNM